MRQINLYIDIKVRYMSSEQNEDLASGTGTFSSGEQRQDSDPRSAEDQEPTSRSGRSPTSGAHSQSQSRTYRTSDDEEEEEEDEEDRSNDYDSEDPQDLDSQGASKQVDQTNSLKSKPRRNVIDQLRITGGVTHDTFDSQSNMSSNTNLLDKLKEQIAGHEDQKYKVDPAELRSIYMKFDRDRTKQDYLLLSNFFHKNPVFSALRSQVDQSCIEELLKNFELEKKVKGDQIYRYGQPNCTAAYFILSGTVSLKVPTLETVQVRSHNDLIIYLAENSQDVIWHKCLDGEDLRSEVQQYKLTQVEQIGAVDVAIDDLTDIKRETKSMVEGNECGQSSQDRKALDLKSNGFHVTTGKEFNRSKRSKKNSSKQSSNKVMESHYIWMFKAVEILGPTQNFGEIALVNAKKLRTATAQCEEACEILSLTRDIYERILDKALRRDKEKRIECLRRFRIFKHMSNKQLERLVPRIQQQTINRGKLMYKEGDAASGVYFIVSGGFEVSTRRNHVHEIAKQAEDNFIDPIARLKLNEQTKVTFDRSLQTMKVAVLGKGEILGIEECQQRCNRLMPGEELVPRQTSAKCVEHESQVLFLSYQDWSDFVLTDMLTGKQVKVESIIKDYFKEARSGETQKTIWDGKNEQRSVIVDGNYEEETTGILRKPKESKLFKAEDYVNDKYWAQYMGLMVSNLKERGEDYMKTIDTQSKESLLNLQEKNEHEFQAKYQFKNKWELPRKETNEFHKPINHHVSIKDNIAYPMESIFSQESSMFPHHASIDHNVSLGPEAGSHFHGEQSRSTQPTQKHSPTHGSMDLIPKQHHSINLIEESELPRQVHRKEIDSIQSLQQPLGSYADLPRNYRHEQSPEKVKVPGITQVVHQVVSGRMSLDSAEIRHQKKTEEQVDSVAVWKTATEMPASKTYSAINEAQHLDEINKKNRGRMQANRVATDGDAAEILEELNRQETDEHSQDFPLTKIMTPLSGHRFHSERVGFPAQTTPVDPKIKQKKTNMMPQKGNSFIINKDGKKIGLAKPMKKESTRKSDNNQRMASRTIDHDARQSTAANKNTSDIIYVDGGPSRTGEDAVRVIQVQKRTASGRHQPLNSLHQQEVINLLPFEQLQTKVEHYNVVDKDRLPQIKKSLMGNEQQNLLSGRGSPLGLTKNLKQMQRRVAATNRNQQISEFQTVPALFARQYKQKALMGGRQRSIAGSHGSGIAHFQNQNLSNINQSKAQIQLSLQQMSERGHSLLQDSGFIQSTQATPTLPNIHLDNQFDKNVHNTLFAPSTTTNARMKKMLRGKTRKDKSLAVAQEKARLKEVVYTKDGKYDMQASQLASTPLNTHQEKVTLLDAPPTKDQTPGKGEGDLGTLVGSQGSQEDNPILVNKDMHKLFMHSGSGDVRGGAVRQAEQVHNIPQPSREEQESALQSLKSEEMMASKQTSYQDGHDIDQHMNTGHQMQPVSHTNTQQAILQPSPTSSATASHAKLEPQQNPNVISQNAAQAAGELMQSFLQNPRAGGPTISDFQQIQQKFQLTANEAYQIVIQQIQLQRLIFQPPTAATVVKISHQSYTSHIQTKREEVNMFRNVLMHKFSFDRTLKSNHAKNKKMHESQNDSKIQGVSTQTQVEAAKQLKMLQRQGASQSVETTGIHHPASIQKLANDVTQRENMEQDRTANGTLQEHPIAQSPGLIAQEV